MATTPKLTEAQALREYLKVKAIEQALHIAALRTLIEQSSLTLDEAGPFYNLIQKMEREAIKYE